jgi:hypothetical protein
MDLYTVLNDFVSKNLRTEMKSLSYFIPEYEILVLDELV